ncbi:MAG TPA: cupin domain-containing protein [Segetibacter sp.]|jgi:quercetin 2,3-dioxygenase
MQRKRFLLAALTVAPAVAFTQFTQRQTTRTKKAFKVDAGKSRNGEIIKYRGVHPNDNKVSSKDTDNGLSIFEYTGYAKTGPSLHLHFEQEEIFYVVEGEYRFVVGDETINSKAGDTIFLPRNIPHTWIQLTDFGKMIYFLQPAGKMEAFFQAMNSLQKAPTEAEIREIHKLHGMQVVGPPLTL